MFTVSGRTHVETWLTSSASFRCINPLQQPPEDTLTPTRSPTLLATGPTSGRTPSPTTISPTSGEERSLWAWFCTRVSEPARQAGGHLDIRSQKKRLPLQRRPVLISKTLCHQIGVPCEKRDPCSLRHHRAVRLMEFVCMWQMHVESRLKKRLAGCGWLHWFTCATCLNISPSPRHASRQGLLRGQHLRRRRRRQHQVHSELSSVVVNACIKALAQARRHLSTKSWS